MFIMCTGRQVMSMAATASVAAVVSGVSGFAQSNSGYSAVFAIDRASPPIVREYVPRDDGWPIPSRLPSNVSVPSNYEPLVATMLQRSPTFRRQCRRIAHAANLTISVRSAGLSVAGRLRARTTIVTKNGTVSAAIEVRQMEDPVELIAHEIEHIIEQLDGIDLASKAAISTSGVHTAASDRHAYETVRAKRVGLAVAAEVRAGSR